MRLVDAILNGRFDSCWPLGRTSKVIDDSAFWFDESKLRPGEAWENHPEVRTAAEQIRSMHDVESVSVCVMEADNLPSAVVLQIMRKGHDRPAYAQLVLEGDPLHTAFEAYIQENPDNVLGDSWEEKPQTSAKCVEGF